MLEGENEGNTTGRQSSPVRERMITANFDKIEKIEVVPEETYKSFPQFLAITTILAISSFEFGYAFCEISTVPITDLIVDYHMDMDPGLANGILCGIMPIGGIFGCLLNRLFLIVFTRKSAHFVVSIINICSTVLVQINTIETILIGRFILGICCGVYTVIAPQYIKEVAPIKLRGLFGSFFSFGRAIGIVFCYALGDILEYTHVQAYYRVMFAFPGGLAIFQSIMIYFFVPDSPVEMLEKFKNQTHREYVIALYKPEAVEYVIKEMKAEFEVQQAALNAAKALENPDYIDPYSSNRKRAYIMAVYLHMYRQFIGINTFVAFAGQMVSTIDAPLAPFADLILNSIQLVFTTLAAFWINKKFGLRALYLGTCVGIAISNYMVMIGYLINNSQLLVAFMIIYMSFFGIFAPVSWSYTAEIIPPTQSTIATSFTWIALALTTLIPPIVIEKMNGNAYPLFLFFGVYTTLSFFYMLAAMVESKGKKYQQIIEKY